eukprot:1305103-Amorphochlora_amoeboformis.AAC.1
MHSVTQGDVTKSGSRVPTKVTLCDINISFLIPGFRRLSFRRKTRLRRTRVITARAGKMSMSGEQMK